MFDEVHFTGTINLGNIVNVLVFLIGSIALYYRVKAEFIKRQNETGEKVITAIKRKMLPDRRKIPPADDDPPL